MATSPAPAAPDSAAPTGSAREHIFGRIRTALAPLPLAERAPLPEWGAANIVTRQQEEVGADAWEAYAIRLLGVNGTPLGGLPALGAWLAQEGMTVACCDPALVAKVRPYLPGVELAEAFDRARLDDYQVGITAAAGVIAETGSVILRDRETFSRLAALAPWTHVALVHPRNVYRTVLEATEKLGNDPNVIWVTGPSKTADVEGILIEGVHGPGRQLVVLTDAVPPAE